MAEHGAALDEIGRELSNLVQRSFKKKLAERGLDGQAFLEVRGEF